MGDRRGIPCPAHQCEVECEDEDQIADTLSRLHGWLVSSFVVENSTSLPVDPGHI